MIELTQFGLRQGIWLIAALVGLYVLIQVLRLLRVGRRPPVMRNKEPQAPGSGVDSLVDLSKQLPAGLFDAPPFADPSAAESERHREPEPAAAFAAMGATGWDHPAQGAADTPDFAQELQRSSVEAELQKLRRESVILREEVARLREELSGMKAARNVSPLYSEAMAMAQSGESPDGIAGQCGISLAEAQLLAALARGETEDDAFSIGEETNDGYPPPGSRTGTHG